MKCAFIYNPRSGKCKQEKNTKYIVSRLEKKYETVDVFPTQYSSHATDLARACCGKYDLLVVAGGDGTLSEVIGGLAEQEGSPTLGYIPLGTVNDVGHSLCLSKNIKKALDIILAGKTFKHDIFKAGERYGIYVCCAGLFTETSYATKQKDKKIMGKLAYAFHGVKKMFSTPSFDIKLKFDGGELTTKAAFLLMLNCRTVASFGINRKAKLNDGQLDILVIKESHKRVSLFGAIRVLSIFLLGLRAHHYAVRLQLESCHVEVGDENIINVDGERAGQGSFDMKVIREGIEFVVSEKFLKAQDRLSKNNKSKRQNA